VAGVVDPGDGGSSYWRWGFVIGCKASESTPDFPKAVTAPRGAPNVLLVMTADVGFGASRTLGGPIPTLSLDRVAHRVAFQ
jgi:hypothetical protein